jgi:hypothetical protein
MSLPVPNSAVSPDVALVRVTEIMQEIREQIHPTASRREAYLRILERSSILLPELSSLERAVEAVRRHALEVGSMPAAPPTFRGRMGAKLVGMIRRALFWYTPQLHSFHLQVASAVEEQTSVTKALLKDLREVHVLIAELKRRLDQGSETWAPPADATVGERPEWRE